MPKKRKISFFIPLYLLLVFSLLIASIYFVSLNQDNYQKPDKNSERELDKNSLVLLSNDLPCSSVTQYGITWTFNGTYTCGQFVNDDWWVVGPVTITSITPDASGERNGWMVNPTSTVQSYDNRSGNYNSGLMPSLPYVAQGGSSIIKTISNAGTQCEYNSFETCHLDSVAVLTVLSAIPSANAFRPPFYGNSKTIYDSSNIQTNLLLSLTPPQGASIQTLSNVENNFKMPQLDYPGWGARSLHPDKALPNYGGDIALRTGDAALRLLLNDSIQEKMPALINYIQAGIDYYGFISNGISYESGGGGHENGRKAPLAFAAILLDDLNMKNAVSSGGRAFGENKIAALDRSGTFPLAAQESCTESNYWYVIHNIDPGSKTCADPYGYIDGGYHPLYDGYQATYSNDAVGGTLSTILLSGGSEVWNNSVQVDYIERWVSSGVYVQPDPCAPAPGVCVGGSNSGTLCNSATRDSTSYNTCLGGGNCSLYTTFPPSGYGITYGPNGQGGCILDNNSSDGIGRFPYAHGGHPQGYSSAFANAMWLNYYGSNVSSNQSVCTNGQRRSCENQIGVCSGSEEVCTGGQWPGCNYSSISGHAYSETGSALCIDNIDNDCDGNYDYYNDVTRADDGCGMGITSISAPSAVCSGGNFTLRCTNTVSNVGGVWAWYTGNNNSGCSFSRWNGYDMELNCINAQTTGLVSCRIAPNATALAGFETRNQTVVVDNSPTCRDNPVLERIDPLVISNASSSTLTFTGTGFSNNCGIKMSGVLINFPNYTTDCISSTKINLTVPSGIPVGSYALSVIGIYAGQERESASINVSVVYNGEICGDAICSLSESCSSCAFDCGTCPSTSSSGGSSSSGSSGGSSGGPKPKNNSPKTQCSDGVDNDGDNLIDYPIDLGCASIMDNIELDSPSLGTSTEESESNQDELKGENKEGSYLTKTFWIILICIVIIIIVVIVLILRTIRKKDDFSRLLK